MKDETLHKAAELALAKQETACKKPLKFFAGAFLAGIFIIIGIILSTYSAALFFSTDAVMAKMVNAVTMSIALTLIVFIGGELFTGINFVMATGLYTKRCSVSGILKTWLYCWLGNIVACALFGTLFAFCVTGSEFETLRVYLTAAVPPKLNMEWYIIIIKGAFANLCVCSGVLASLKLKSEPAKLAVIILCVVAFIVPGFEHSIANAGLFTIAAFYADGFDFTKAAANILLSSIGNILGGSVLLGLPYYCLCKNSKEKQL